MIIFSKYKRFIRIEEKKKEVVKDPVFGRCVKCNGAFVIQNKEQQHCLYCKPL